MTDGICRNHIIFIGFMGSGKSTIARKLARYENMTSVDMDASIAREAGMSIPEIFEAEGESGFRAREHALLESMLYREPCIISCGGGVVVSAENRRLITSLGTVVYLEVTAEESRARISRPQSRPLLNGSVSPAELLEQRRALYEEIADIRFSTSGLAIGQVVSQLAIILKERGIL